MQHLVLFDVGAANQMKAGVNRGGVGVGAPKNCSMQNHYFVQFLSSTDKIILTCDLVSCWYLSCFMPLNRTWWVFGPASGISAKLH